MSNEKSETKVFSKESLVEFVKSHPENTYISIHENVYDVTTFLDEHPGGEETLKEVQIRDEFRDATESFEDTGHSMDARDMMQKYQIGKLETKKETPKPSKSLPTPKSQEKSNFLTWTIPGLVIIALALGYHYFSSRSRNFST